jgi:succinylglutamate desuccinylase
MTGAELKAAEQIANSQNAWAILFILLFSGCIIWFRQYSKRQETLHAEQQARLDKIHEESRQEAKEREKALLMIIERQNDSLENINNTQVAIQSRIEKLEDRFDTAIDLRNRNFQELKIGRDK